MDGEEKHEPHHWLPRKYSRKASAKGINGLTSNGSGTSLQQTPTVLSLHEAGIARLVISPDEPSCFQGILINAQAESFQIMATPSSREELSAASLLFNMEGFVPNRSENENGQGNGCTPCSSSENEELEKLEVDVTVVDGETAQRFVLKRVQMSIDTAGQHVCSLRSDNISFTTTDVLIGARAVLEIKNYFSPELIQAGTVVHIGSMSLNVQTALTPPPTPQRPPPSADTISNASSTMDVSTVADAPTNTGVVDDCMQ